MILNTYSGEPPAYLGIRTRTAGDPAVPARRVPVIHWFSLPTAVRKLQGRVLHAGSRVRYLKRGAGPGIPTWC